MNVNMTGRAISGRTGKDVVLVTARARDGRVLAKQGEARLRVIKERVIPFCRPMTFRTIISQFAAVWIDLLVA